MRLGLASSVSELSEISEVRWFACKVSLAGVSAVLIALKNDVLVAVFV